MRLDTASRQPRIMSGDEVIAIRVHGAWQDPHGGTFPTREIMRFNAIGLRALVAEAANDAVARSRRVYPRLTADSARQDLLRWMQTNDPNGCHTDDLARAENFDPYTLDEAWDALADMVGEALLAAAGGPR